jgi:hypothetical protein
MKNDFINIFKPLEASVQKKFQQYIEYFHAPEKGILEVFYHALTAIDKEKDIFTLSQKARILTSNDLGDLKKWLIEFLTIQEIQSNSYEAQFLTLEVLRKKKLQPELRKKTKDLKKELTQHPTPDIWIAMMKLRLAHMDYFAPEVDKVKDQKAPMQQLIDELDNFYIYTKLKYATELESRKNIRKEQFTSRLLNEIMNLAETDATIHPSIKSVYVPLLKLTKDQSESAFSELKNFIIQDTMHDKREKLDILIYLLNYTIAGQRQEPKKYYQAYFDVIEIGLEQALFTATGYFPLLTFINIVNTASYLKQDTWANTFIDNWSKQLDPIDKKFGENVAKARIHFENNKFRDAINLLNGLDYKNDHFEIGIRLLLARAYFEDNFDESVQISHCNSSESYIRKNSNLEARIKEKIFNFFKILRFLINKKDKEQLLKAFDKKANIAYPEWLLEKIKTPKK